MAFIPQINRNSRTTICSNGQSSEHAEMGAVVQSWRHQRGTGMNYGDETESLVSVAEKKAPNSYFYG